MYPPYSYILVCSRISIAMFNLFRIRVPVTSDRGFRNRKVISVNELENELTMELAVKNLNRCCEGLWDEAFGNASF